jgi:hypothetical protein
VSNATAAAQGEAGTSAAAEAEPQVDAADAGDEAASHVEIVPEGESDVVKQARLANRAAARAERANYKALIDATFLKEDDA